MDYKLFFNAGLKSDKITHHGYHRIYPWFLNHFRNYEKVNLLEIGVDEQNSIHLWLDFFPEAEITVMDIDDKNVQSCRFVKLDQSSEKELVKYAKDNNEQHHIIVDDGSHVPEHQMLTLIQLWKTLKPGGVYIIEDIETSYWGNSDIYGYKFNSDEFNFVQKVINSIHEVNSEFFADESNLRKGDFGNLMKEVEMISFAHNCIILIKKSPDFIEYYNRDYRFKNVISHNKKRPFSIFKKITDKISRNKKS